MKKVHKSVYVMVRRDKNLANRLVKMVLMLDIKMGLQMELTKESLMVQK